MQKEQAGHILRQLEQNGYEAYFVGGCVRDWLLGRPFQDIDICTNAHPVDVMRIFPEHIPTGLKHGTVSIKQGGYLFEVTTYRTEGEYLDYRRPEHVSFVSDLTLDLARRDFTINAMAMDAAGTVIDPFGGQQDLQHQVIKAVGVALDRFNEDALRILRAIRFAGQLDFSIEPATLAAIAQTAERLGYIAVERIRVELNKLLAGKALMYGLEVVHDTDVFRAVPPLRKLFMQVSKEAWRLRHVTSCEQRWALFFYMQQCSLTVIREVCQFLRMSKRESETIERYCQLLHEIKPEWDMPITIGWERLLLTFELSTCQDVEAILAAIWWNQQGSQMMGQAQAAYEQLPVKSLRDLQITGKDLQAISARKPGEWIAQLLHFLWEQAALHGLPNTPQSLLAAAKSEVERFEKD